MRKSMIILFILSLAVLFSCSRIEIELPEGSNGEMLSEGQPVNMSLFVEDMDYEGEPQTKAVTTEEKRIDNIWILQFNGTSSASVLISRQFASLRDINKVFITPITAVNRIVILANYSYRNDIVGLELNTTTYADLMKLSIPTGEMIKNITTLNGAVPMCGQTDVSVPAQGEIPEVDIHLTRTVAKVRINITAATLSDYELDSIFVSNVPDISYYYPDFSADRSVEYPASTSTVTRTTYYTSPEHSKKITGGASTQTSFVFYVPVNIQGKVSPSGVVMTDALRRQYAPDNATLLIIRGQRQKDAAMVWYHKYIGGGTVADQSNQDYTDFNVLPNHCYTYNYNIVGHNAANNRSIEKGKICNSYCVSPSSSDVTIPINTIEMVNRFWKVEKMKIHPKDDIRMKTIWQEGPPDSSTPAAAVAIDSLEINRRTDSHSIFDIKVKSGVYGNYLVAVQKKIDGEYVTLWSYHIWSSKTDPRDETFISNNATVMRRNLGASWEPTTRGSEDIWNGDGWDWGVCNQANTTTATYHTNRCFGLYYQWGRKDPFMSLTSNGTSSQSADIFYAAGHPDKFLTTEGRWCSDNNSWNDSSDRKTMNDPCPAGWRVSESDAWKDIISSSSTTNSYWRMIDLIIISWKQFFYAGNILFCTGNSDVEGFYSHINYLPIPGYLNSSATVMNRDNYSRSSAPTGKGVYWTSSASGNRGTCLLLNNSESNYSIGIDSNTYSKITGGNIRCQKDGNYMEN